MEKILETPRLYLRCLQLTDAVRMSEYRSKKEVAHYQSWKKYSIKDATKRIQQSSLLFIYRKQIIIWLLF